MRKKRTSNTVALEPGIVVGLDLSKQEYDPDYVLSTGETGTQANERRDRERYPETELKNEGRYPEEGLAALTDRLARVTPAVSSVELTDEQADWLISRLEWTAGLHVGLSAEFKMAFGVGVELGVREEHRDEARAAVRRIARLG